MDPSPLLLGVGTKTVACKLIFVAACSIDKTGCQIQRDFRNFSLKMIPSNFTSHVDLHGIPPKGVQPVPFCFMCKQCYQILSNAFDTRNSVAWMQMRFTA